MTFKIVSWNVNGIRAIKKKGFFEYLEQENPDVLCVQETKASIEQLEDDLINPLGYYSSIYHSCSIKKGYSGTAIFFKEKPINKFTGFGIEKFDNEGRVSSIEYKDFILFNVYFPNSAMDGRLEYKLEFYEHFFAFCNQLKEKGKNLIICGDYNTAHKEIDLARPKDNLKSSGFLPIERKWIDKIIEYGYIDTFRYFNKEPGFYTWWSMQTRARERNIGWRIDYHFVTNSLINKVKSSYMRPEIIGSDHCPIVLELDL
jgi:exodeoxyribonuclease-3